MRQRSSKHSKASPFLDNSSIACSSRCTMLSTVSFSMAFSSLGTIPQAIIPPRSNREVPEHPDYRRYRDRNRIERMFAKLKQQRRIAI